MTLHTLDEAARLLKTATIKSFDSSNKPLVRDLEWVLASCQGAGYASRIMRYVLDNITDYQRRGQRSFYCATPDRMALNAEANPVKIKWHAGQRPLPYLNDHLIPLKQQYLQMTRMQVKDIEQIYDYIARWNWILAVTADEEKRLMKDTMPHDWDGEDLFARPRQREITHIHLFPGGLASGYWHVDNLGPRS